MSYTTKEEEEPEEFGAIPQCTHVSVVGVPGGQILRLISTFFFFEIFLKCCFEVGTDEFRKPIWQYGASTTTRQNEQFFVCDLFWNQLTVWPFACCQIQRFSLTDAPKREKF
ncbi:hypothetical protein OUZ56_004605 [Daphnia magna]|uniref:Uncharacterized protein n=1 Tax=Daphnia magna TaxID=35525 RepID=A0ABQ9YQA3_9CRUS|nr:hypothetical protein OUZ56_004605 [Daphnia magna]